MADLPKDIIETLNKLSFRELLSYVLLAKLSGQLLDYAKKRIKETWDKKQYGFSPSKDEAIILKRISRADVYERLKFCLGQHWSLSLIKVGIYISDLNIEGQQELVEKINEDIFKKYGKRGKRIMELGSTGVIRNIIEYISDLKIRKNYNRDDLIREFENILEDWNRITIFVKSNDTKDDIVNNLKKQIEFKYNLFFVFAFGSASVIAYNAIAQANNEGIISEGKYMFSTRPSISKVGKEVYAWTFELIN